MTKWKLLENVGKCVKKEKLKYHIDSIQVLRLFTE